MVDKGAEGGGVDAYVGRKALRKCGGIYVVSRRDGLVKVGITEGDFSRRFKELDQASRSAGIVGIQPEILVPLDEGMTEVESAVHEKLSTNREGGEWFRVSTEDAVNAVLSAVVCQRVRNAKYRQCIQAGAMEKRQEDAGHPSCKEVIEAALFAAQKIDNRNPYSRAGALYAIVEAQTKAGDIDGAFATAQGINAADSRDWALKDIAVARAKVGDIDGAFATIQSMNGTDSRDSALRTIVEAQAKAGDIDDALVTVQSINNTYSRDWALNDIAVARAKAGDIDDALVTVQSINDTHFRNRALNDIAVAQAKAGDVDGAFATAQNIGVQNIDDAKDPADPQDPADSDLDIFADAPDPLSYDNLCAIAEAQAKMEDIDGAKDKASALCIPADVRMKAGDIDRAFAAAQSIDDAKDRVSALCAIVGRRMETGNKQRGKDIISAALSAARSIDNATHRASAVRAIAEAQAESGNFRDAVRTATRGIAENDVRAEVLAVIAKHLAARERN